MGVTRLVAIMFLRYYIPNFSKNVFVVNFIVYAASSIIPNLQFKLPINSTSYLKYVPSMYICSHVVHKQHNHLAGFCPGTSID